MDTPPAENLSVGRNMKIGLFHLGSGMADVIITGFWNRIYDGVTIHHLDKLKQVAPGNEIALTGLMVMPGMFDTMPNNTLEINKGWVLEKTI